MSPNARNRPAGFTLVELLVVTTITVTIFAAATKFIMSSTYVSARETSAVKVAEDLAAAGNIFLDDMSIAGYAGNGAKLATNATFIAVTTQTASDAVTFEGDIDSNGTTDRICYRVSGGSLQRKIVGTGVACGTTGFETLVDNVNTFTITFLDNSRAVIPSGSASGILDGTANPRYVQITLSLNPTLPTLPAKTMKGEVALRNW
jgi:prepilin-type N-terminal cleavage/methylation domain-containing protein